MQTVELVESMLKKFEAWLTGLVDLVPNLIVALAVMIVFGIGARFVGSGVSAAIFRLTKNEPISGLLGTVARIACWSGGLFIALGLLQLDKTVTTLLAGVGVVGLALGFAFQDIAANFMSGFIIAVRRPFDVGDLVETAGIRGHVEQVELRATLIETLDGLSIIIPNKDVFQNPIINYTKTENRRAEVRVGVAYDTDLERARDLVKQALTGVRHRLAEREPEVFYEQFGSSSIDMVGRVWLTASGQLQNLQAISDGIIAIKKAFDGAGITIPFPIRTLDFGAEAVGGRPMAPPAEAKAEAEA